ncbi:STN domain-containing protein [Novosphingobium sp. M1R2S20]|uniref:STN domain-containing protein n=1 Tax=Novosphingobium rhizovicinum TaxID=3228928 RepID=A0ABV3RA54_9SPHN
MTPSQAMDRLLASTGHVARIDDGIISLHPISTGAADPDTYRSIQMAVSAVSGGKWSG